MESNQHQLSEAQAQKLTNWTKEPSILTLKQDFETAKQPHDAQLAKMQHWNDLMNVRGKAKPAKVKGRSSVQPKLIRRQAEWRYSALTEPFLSSDKLFKVTPTTFEDDAAAKQNALVLNWQFRTKLNRVKFIDDYVRSTVDEGTSIVRLGWKRVTTNVWEEVPVWAYYPIQDQEHLQLFQQALQAREDDHRTFMEGAAPELVAALEYYDETQTPTLVQQTGTERVKTTKVLENHPTVEVLNPQNFYIDASCNGDINKALFAVVSFETNKAELLKEPDRYKNLDRVNWEMATPVMEPDHATTTPDVFTIRDPLRKRVVAYEYWGFYDIDGKGELTPIVVTWIGDTIIRMEKNPFPDQKLPFVVVPYLPVKRELYGEPDAELLEDNQAILGAVTRGMIDLLGRSANGQQGMAKGMLDPTNRRKFQNGEDYEFNPNMPLNQGLIEHKFPELPQSALLMLNLQNQEAEALTGVKSFSGGVSSETYGDVAAGIRGALDAASKREMAILRRLAKGLQEIGTKIVAMNQVFLSEEETVRVTNEDFVTVKREDLQGNFDLEVDISTAEVDSQKAQDLAFMLQTIGNNMDIGITLMILAEIATLKRMPALAKKLLSYKPTPTPEQQKMQELAIEKAMLENEELKSKIRLNDANAEEAKANKDKKDLDYVEQETGTAHAREMEKQRGQAEGNQDLEVTKALLKPRKQANGGEGKPDVDAAVGWNTLSAKKDDPRHNSGVDNVAARDAMAPFDPRFSLGSRFFDPKLDPTLNPAINFK